jgi:hypothetical protein
MPNVTVIRQVETQASNVPTFIIRVTDSEGHDVHYLTLAVWEYDSAHAVGQAQIDGCQSLSDEFDAASAMGGPTVAAAIRQGPPSNPDDGNHTDGGG